MVAAATHPVRVPLTYDEYVLFPDDGRRYELMDGDPYVSPAPSTFHQTVSRRLQFALMALLEETRLAFVFDAPVDVILSPTDVVQPDLALVRSARRSIITQRAIEGAPDVVVEILSPFGRDRDERLKYALYARFGVPEYWIVDPEVGHISVNVLGEQGYRVHALCDRASRIESPGFSELTFPLEPLFRPL